MSERQKVIVLNQEHLLACLDISNLQYCLKVLSGFGSYYKRGESMRRGEQMKSSCGVVSQALLVVLFSAMASQTGLADASGQVVTEFEPDIMHVYQARNNNYWFGSKTKGVYRYDGKTLVKFTTKDGLSYNSISGIQEDKAGNIYFTTSSEFNPKLQGFTQAICRFDGKTFREVTVPKKTSPAHEWKLQPDDLWFGGGQDSGVVYRFDGTTMHRLEFPNTKDGDEFLATYPRAQYPNMRYNPYDTYINFKDRKGHMWFGTSSLGVCRFDGKSFTWLPERELQHQNFGSRSIVEDSAGKFWFCASLHRYSVDLSDNAEPRFQKEPGIRDPKDETRPLIAGIISAVVDDSGSLWFATIHDGVWKYDGQKTTHYPVKHHGKQITLFTISKDNQGVLWLGTQTSGPYKFTGNQFEKFLP